MSKYTTQVRFICESAAGLSDSVGFNDVNRVIQEAIPKVFNFDFPIYDESYRNVLCTKILKHYYTREICAETVGLWKLWLEARLNEIMPYYNQLYKSTLLEFNPLYDVDVITKYERKNDGVTDTNKDGTITRTESDERDVTRNDVNSRIMSGTDEGEGSGESTNRDLFSDTPQNGLNGVDDETYLTNARKITNNSTGNSTSTTNVSENNDREETVNEEISRNHEEKASETGKTKATSTEEYLQRVSGKNGGVSYSKMLKEYRSTFVNIDMEIIDNLSDLFFGLW